MLGQVNPMNQAMAHRPIHPKKARTVFVGGLTPILTADVLRDYFESELPNVPDRPKINAPCVDTVDVKMDKKYAFVEFHNAVDADIAMCMDGCKILGCQIGIRRPTNYVAPPGGQKTWRISGVLSTNVEDGANKIFLGNLPATMNEQEVQMLASAFGDLSAFILSRDNATGLSKGYAFFSYKDAALTNLACAGLNGQEIGGKRIACKVADSKMAGDMGGGMVNPLVAQMQLQQQMRVMAMMNQAGGAGMMGGAGMNPMGMLGMAGGMPGQMPGMPLPVPTAVLIMENMVTEGELADPEEYADIVEDIQDECGNHGAVEKVVIPRPGEADVSKIFVRYADPGGAVKAMGALNGRKFNDRTIAITYMPLEEWTARGW